MHTCCSGTRRDDDCTHMTRARHRTHARTAASATTRAAYQARVVRRSAGRRRKAARWRADAHQLTIWHETRCGVRRAGSAVEGGSGRASATASPVLMPGQSLKRDYIKPHAKARAATDNPKPVPARRVGATQGPRAPWGHTRTLSVAPPRLPGWASGWQWRRGLLHAAGCGSSAEVVPEGGGRRREGKGRAVLWGGDVFGRGGTAAAAVVVRVMVRETSPMPGCTPVPSEDRGPRQMLP